MQWTSIPSKVQYIGPLVLVVKGPWPRRGGLPHETDGDARHLTKGCKFWIMVLLRVFQAKCQYSMLPRSCLGFREETQNCMKRNRSQIFLRFMTMLLKTTFR